LGYSLAGIVEDVGREVTGISPGDLVAAAGAKYANHAEVVAVPSTLVAPAPAGVQASSAAFATVGAIALQGLRQAAPMIGETFLVIGLGLIGQLTVQLLRANGCRVLAHDLRDDLIERAETFGAIGFRAGDNLVNRILEATNGYGADAVILTASTSSSQPAELAANVTREKGRIVVVGAVGLNLPREPLYMKEIEVRLSRSYGPGRYDPRHEEGAQDYPYAYVRFTERRNLEAFLQLVAEGKVDVESLVTHRYPIDRAPEAYELLRGEEPYIGILIEYPSEARPQAPIRLSERHTSQGDLRVSFIGAGNYATARLLPKLKNNPLVKLHAICTGSGLKARDVGERFGFGVCVGDASALLEGETDVVFIATRHDSHARYVVEALNAGKHVFVEKPLCLSRDELDRVSAAALEAKGHLLVGFNRRFAPLTRKVADFIEAKTLPAAITIRVNAGTVDSTSWIRDPEIGGGRILGEVCHFIDLAAAIAGSPPHRVFARAVTDAASSPLLVEDVAITLSMANGSIATIFYTASGAKSMAKERIEIMCAGRSAVIDDFVEARLFGGRDSQKHRLRAQDKGQAAMLDEFLRSLRTTTPLVPLVELLATTEATLAVIDSLCSGTEIELQSHRRQTSSH
jgi:polar amino acid transport system substrate-binding protein